MKPSSRMTLALLIYKCVVDVFVNEVFKVSLNMFNSCFTVSPNLSQH